MVVRFFVRVRVVRHQAEVKQVGGDLLQHADHPQLVELGLRGYRDAGRAQDVQTQPEICLSCFGSLAMNRFRLSLGLVEQLTPTTSVTQILWNIDAPCSKSFFWLALVEMLALKARHELRWKVLQLVALSTSFICSFRCL
jgi:hypothetical protein